MVEEIKKALQKIEKTYLSYPTVKGKLVNQERVFAYEFYHQIRNTIKSNLYVSGETKKGIAIASSGDTSIYPDIIIHDFGINKNNSVAIEIKATSNLKAKSILSDLEKLLLLSKEPFHYPHLIFLAVNCDLKAKINNSKAYGKQILELKEKNPNQMFWNINSKQTENKTNKEKIKAKEIIEL